MSMKRIVLFLATTVVALVPFTASAQHDVVTVGSATWTGGTVDIPVFVRDVSGTQLGVDQPAGSKIQSFSFKVNYSPSSAISGATFTRAGITASLSPTFESSPSSSGSISWLATFAEGSANVPFTLNKAAPGDQVAHIVFTLSGSAAAGSSISLTLDSSVTQLTNQGGTTKESTTSSPTTLTLVNGSISIPALTIFITPAGQNVAPGAKAFYTVNTSSPVGSATTINLSSSNTSIATVPSSVMINQGTSSANFSVTGVAVGNATITAQISGGGASTTASVHVVIPSPTCNVPTVPVLSAPSTAATGTSYDVTWGTSANATEYAIDESTAADFSGATTTTVTDTRATFTHSVSADTRYYYRVVAKNRSTGCDVSALASAAVSVLVQVPPPGVQLTRYLAVVGSTAGSGGSFFKTSVQLYNPQTSTISGNLVFHTGGTSGSASDPSLTYSLAPGKTITYPDLLPAMGLPSGLGTVDIVGAVSSPLPVALVRVFNDGGAAGTSGLTEEAFKAEEALHGGDTGVLIAPSDVAKFRLNIGVRTLTDGANVTFTVRDKDGVIVKTVSNKNFDPTFFTQIGSAPMLDGYAITGGETISVAVNSGSLFIYGATTDNVTQDPSVQFAKKVE
jgi:hypothetical protein